jgi:methyl-accepting chemotaxis protein
MKRIRVGGPPGVQRPFTPTPDIADGLSAEEKQAEALEHIARALSAIDHSLEQIAKNSHGQTLWLQQIANALQSQKR